MALPVEIEWALSHPVVPAGAATEDPVYALLHLRPQPEAAGRPRLDFTFLIDASASMFHFQLDAAQRQYWLRVARVRGDVQQRVVDGRASTVWGGQTMRELQDMVSTPMHCAMRGLWRGLPALAPDDPVYVVAFADEATVVMDDPGHPTLADRTAAAQAALEPLAAGRSAVGHNTRLSQALRLARERVAQAQAARAVHRAVLVSDGKVEDQAACLALLDDAVEHGLVISAIGVGDEFDEEFLMRVADVTRGNYYYAPTAKDLEAALAEEFAHLSAIVARSATLRVTAAPEVVFHELYQTAPEMTRFPVVWVDETGWIYRLGNLPAGRDLQLLASFALPALPEGDATVAGITLQGEWTEEGPELEVTGDLKVLASSDQYLVTSRNDQVLDVAGRLEVYLAERQAQAAEERGDSVTATRHLQSATRMLRSLGDNTLAAEMEQEAAAVGTGARDRGRTKRIKAGTRRLGDRGPVAPPPGGTRRLGDRGPDAAPAGGTRRLGDRGETPPESEGTRRLGGG